MSIYKQLDVMIKDRCMVKEPDLFDDGALILDENTYLQLRDEVNECKAVSEDGILEVDQLSPIAQDIVREWEGWLEDYANRVHESNHAEADCGGV